jgi:hypothetical protein
VTSPQLRPAWPPLLPSMDDGRAIGRRKLLPKHTASIIVTGGFTKKPVTRQLFVALGSCSKRKEQSLFLRASIYLDTLHHHDPPFPQFPQ